MGEIKTLLRESVCFPCRMEKLKSPVNYMLLNNTLKIIKYENIEIPISPTHPNNKQFKEFLHSN
jgi:hypothetical protein